MIGGIVAGFFTATEASAVAVLYALVLAMLYGEVKFKDLHGILLNSVKNNRYCDASGSHLHGFVLDYGL